MNRVNPQEYRYADGTIVMLGDRLETLNTTSAKVLMIIQPVSEDAETYNCPEGGILIEEDWNGTPSLLLMTTPDGKWWDELTFIARHSRG